MVVFTALATIAVWLVVRDAPPGHPFLARKSETPRQMLRGLGQALASPSLPHILVLNFCNYACTFTIQGLWGGPYLREVHGLSAVATGNVLLFAVVAYQCGMLVIGPLDRVLDTRKWIAVAGTVAVAATLATLTLVDHPPLWLAIGALLAIGFVSPASTMIMAHGRAIFPDHLIGRGMSTLNTSVMLGVACMQSLSGVILGTFTPLADGSRTELAYRTLFGVMCVVLVLAVSIYAQVADRKPSDEMRARQKAT